MNETLVDDVFIQSVLDKYSDTVFKIAVQIVKNRFDAEDISQEVFLAILNRKFVDETHLKAWIIRVTYNKSVNRYKENKRRHLYETSIKDYKDYPLSLVSRNEELIEALHHLSPKDKTMFIYFILRDIH